jgi:hypothetical protein
LHGIGIHAAGHVFGVFAQLQIANAGGVFHHFQATEDIALGIGQGFALFRRQQRGQFFHVLADQLLVLEENPCAGADGVFFQLAKAVLALATAACTSSAWPSGPVPVLLAWPG